MSDGGSQARPSESSTDKYGLMSSIAAVREIILHSAATENDAVKELSTKKQQSYQVKLQLEEELQKQRSVLKDLGSKAEHAKEEAQREKTMRQVLEVAHSKLEDHRTELMRQLESTKASQAGMEEKIVRFREDLDEQNTAFEKERAKWEELVKVMRAQDKSSKKEIGELDARIATSQQAAKDAESQIEDLKKQVESADIRHAETVKLYKTTIDNLNKRIENGEVDTIESLRKRIAEAESNYETTLEKLRNAREDLLSFRQFSDKRSETILSKKSKDKLLEELASAESSLNEAEKEFKSNKEILATLEEDDSEKTGEALSQHTSDLAKAKLEGKKSTLKLRQSLKKLDGLYKRRLELVKTEVTGTKEDLDTVMERLGLVKEDATKAQADFASFQSRKAALLGDKDGDASKKRAADAGETGGDKRQKQS